MKSEGVLEAVEGLHDARISAIALKKSFLLHSNNDEYKELIGVHRIINGGERTANSCDVFLSSIIPLFETIILDSHRIEDLVNDTILGSDEKNISTRVQAVTGSINESKINFKESHLLSAALGPDIDDLKEDEIFHALEEAYRGIKQLSVGLTIL